MAAFPGPNGTTLLVRNHEFRIGHPDDLGPFGGTKKALEEARPALDLRPEARRDALPRLGHDDRLRHEAEEGLGPAPEPGRDPDELLRRARRPGGRGYPPRRSSWGPGRPTASGRHGYTFEVSRFGRARGHGRRCRSRPWVASSRKAPRSIRGPASSTRPRTSLDGIFYRFLPGRRRAGSAEGGRLQALAVAGWPGLRDEQLADADDRERPGLRRRLDRSRGARSRTRTTSRHAGPGEQEPPSSPAARAFSIATAGRVWFACTNGGTDGPAGRSGATSPVPTKGRPARRTGRDGSSSWPSPTIAAVLDHPDQAGRRAVGRPLHLRGRRRRRFPSGASRTVGRLLPVRPPGRGSESEPAGACFSPDRTTLFLNDLPSGLTFAVTGPWKWRFRRLAIARPGGA
ncbi:MAG: hypothetical protein MZU79_04525 [Anaerotruncus sp.]|nr:hypothetical protein [Anaerotruncus sp.]